MPKLEWIEGREDDKVDVLHECNLKKKVDVCNIWVLLQRIHAMLSVHYTIHALLTADVLRWI